MVKLKWEMIRPSADGTYTGLRRVDLATPESIFDVNGDRKICKGKTSIGVYLDIKDINQ